MASSQPVTRYCFYNPNGGILSIKLTVCDQIVAGSDFKIYDSNKVNVLEQLKITVEDRASKPKSVQVLLKDLNKANMIWKIVCCTKNPNLYSCNVKVEIFQDDSPLKMNFPAEKNLTNIPPCATGSVDSYNGSLVFLPKE